MNIFSIKNGFQQRPFLRIALSLLLFLPVSCRKWVQVDPSPVQIESEKVFGDDRSATSAVTGLYSQMLTGSLSLTNGGATLFPALSADEIYNTGNNTTAEPFYTNALSETNANVSSRFWSPAYRFIYQANAILEGLKKSNSLSPALKEQLTGEMKCVRALNYFYLVNLFGALPLVTTTAYQENMVMPRKPEEAIYSQMISDLQDAKNKLPESYPSPGRARPDKFAAVALLARVQLYHENWEQAEMEASVVIDADIYQLQTDLNQVFLTGNLESIWQLVNDNNNTVEGATFIPSSASARPAYALTETLLNSFEPGDKRKISWLKANTVGTKVYYYPYKYKVRINTPLTESLVVLRLAEQYLIRAEARANQNNLEGAMADVNIVRARAGLLPLNISTQAMVLDAIQKERQTELFTEWGNRWLDLKRTGTADAVLSGIKPSWHAYAVLYPLPFNELQRNPFLVQNPGY